MLDAAPMHGSKRVPMIEIEDDGTASIDLWCASLKAQATVNDAAITIVPGDPPPAQCDPDRQARDAELLATLTQVTGWRRSGEVDRAHRRDAVALPPDDELTRFAVRWGSAASCA